MTNNQPLSTLNKSHAFTLGPLAFTAVAYIVCACVGPPNLGMLAPRSFGRGGDVADSLETHPCLTMPNVVAVVQTVWAYVSPKNFGTLGPHKHGYLISGVFEHPKHHLNMALTGGLYYKIDITEDRAR